MGPSSACFRTIIAYPTNCKKDCELLFEFPLWSLYAPNDNKLQVRV